MPEVQIRSGRILMLWISLCTSSNAEWLGLLLAEADYRDYVNSSSIDLGYN